MSQPEKDPTPAGVAEILHQEIAERAIELPLLPNVAAEVLSSSLDDQATAARLAELIQQDQGLASHLLRVVNSPAFRGSAEIVALQQAIARLGMERIREIALTVSLKGSLFKSGPFEQWVADAWRSGLCTGLWAKEVARAALKNVETAYLCGLLHNVGEALILNRLSALSPDFDGAQMRGLLDDVAPSAGVMLVEEWRLPSAVGLTIRFIENFSAAKNAQDTVAVVAAGRYLAQRQAQGGLELDAVLQFPALQHLNFYPDDVETLLAHAEGIQETLECMV